MTDAADTAPAPDLASVTRKYADEEVCVRIRGLGTRRSPMVHIEHKDGAALIVPECERVEREGGAELSTRGFDGTVFRLWVDDLRLEVEATRPTAILGGRLKRSLIRGEDIVPSPATLLRVTGDEVTMPIVSRLE